MISAKQSRYVMVIHLFLYMCKDELVELGIRFELEGSKVVEDCLRAKSCLELNLINTFLSSDLI